MNKIVTIYDAKTNLSKYINQAKSGTPVYIGSYGKQEVVLTAAKPTKPKITFGTAAGKLKKLEKQTEDLDSTIQDMFYGENWDKK